MGRPKGSENRKPLHPRIQKQLDWSVGKLSTAKAASAERKQKLIAEKRASLQARLKVLVEKIGRDDAKALFDKHANGAENITTLDSSLFGAMGAAIGLEMKRSKQKPPKQQTVTQGVREARALVKEMNAQGTPIFRVDSDGKRHIDLMLPPVGSAPGATGAALPGSSSSLKPATLATRSDIDKFYAAPVNWSAVHQIDIQQEARKQAAKARRQPAIDRGEDEPPAYFRVPPYMQQD